METKRKLLIIARHGEAPQRNSEDQIGSLDELFDHSVQFLYRKGALLQDLVNINNAESIFLQHSGMKRAYFTGKALIAGMIGLKPNPSSQENLSMLKYGGLREIEDSLLDFSDIRFNEAIYLLDAGSTYLKKWIADPDKDRLQDVEVTPFNEVVESRRSSLAKAVSRLISDDRRFGILATHGMVAEALTANAITSGESSKIRDIEEIGGQYKMGDTARLVMDGKGSNYDAYLERNGERYPVNISKLRN